MKNLKEVLESTGLSAQRGVYNGRDKPKAYYTFLRILKEPLINTDDEMRVGKEMYRVTLFYRGDFEDQLKKTLKVLKDAGAYINSVDSESYEVDTGYWIVPITIEVIEEQEN